jgi:hypothetical protein
MRLLLVAAVFIASPAISNPTIVLAQVDPEGLVVPCRFEGCALEIWRWQQRQPPPKPLMLLQHAKPADELEEDKEKNGRSPN